MRPMGFFYHPCILPARLVARPARRAGPPRDGMPPGSRAVPRLALPGAPRQSMSQLTRGPPSGRFVSGTTCFRACEGAAVRIWRRADMAPCGHIAAWASCERASPLGRPVRGYRRTGAGPQRKSACRRARAATLFEMPRYAGRPSLSACRCCRPTRSHGRGRR